MRVGTPNIPWSLRVTTSLFTVRSGKVCHSAPIRPVWLEHPPESFDGTYAVCDSRFEYRLFVRNYQKCGLGPVSVAACLARKLYYSQARAWLITLSLDKRGKYLQECRWRETNIILAAMRSVDHSTIQLCKRCDIDSVWKNGLMLAYGTENQGIPVQETQIYVTTRAQVYKVEPLFLNYPARLTVIQEWSWCILAPNTLWQLLHKSSALLYYFHNSRHAPLFHYFWHKEGCSSIWKTLRHLSITLDRKHFHSSSAQPPLM